MTTAAFKYYLMNFLHDHPKEKMILLLFLDCVLGKELQDNIPYIPRKVTMKKEKKRSSSHHRVLTSVNKQG